MKIRNCGFFLACVIGWGLFLATPAQAELYLAGQVGASWPNRASDVQGTGIASGLTASDLALKNSFLYGGKIGYFFRYGTSVGIEIEAFTTNPHLKEQATTISFGGLPIAMGILRGIHFRLITTAANVIVRFPGRQFGPYLEPHFYIGAGPGIFFARLSDLPGTSSDTSLGLNALGGVRVFVHKNVAWFVEYKYNRATFEFDELLLKADYSAHNVAFGVGLHF